MAFDRQRAIDLGREAEQVLRSESFAEAVRRTEQQIITEWRHAPTFGERERAHTALGVLENIVQQLQSVMNDGLVELALKASEEDRGD